MHFCVNLVCLGDGTRVRRAAAGRGGDRGGGAGPSARRTPGDGPGYTAPVTWPRGPARLCQALGIDRVAGRRGRVRPGSPSRGGRRPTTGRSAEEPYSSGAAGRPARGRGRHAAVLELPGRARPCPRPRRHAVSSTGEPTARDGGRGETGYPSGPRRWHHAGVNDIIDELTWRGLLADHHRSRRAAQGAGLRPGHVLRAASTRPRRACTSATWCCC